MDFLFTWGQEKNLLFAEVWLGCKEGGKERDVIPTSWEEKKSREGSAKVPESNLDLCPTKRHVKGLFRVLQKKRGKTLHNAY